MKPRMPDESVYRAAIRAQQEVGWACLTEAERRVILAYEDLEGRS